jgi:hypothetical protein
MQKWEYMTQTLVENGDKIMSEWGVEGWELVAVTQESDYERDGYTTTHCPTGYFKRPVMQQRRKQDGPDW